MRGMYKQPLCLRMVEFLPGTTCMSVEREIDREERQRWDSNELRPCRGNAPSEKQDSFAIGVSPAHYWMITAMAKSQNFSRTQALEGIIEHYIHTVLAKGGTK